MTHIEGSEGQSPTDKPKPPIEIGITPFDQEQTVFKRTPDGGLTVFLRGEITLTVHPPVAETTESPVPPASAPDSGLLPDSASQPVTEPHSAADRPSWEQSLTDGEEIPDSENRKFQLTGNPARILGYRVTRKSNTRIADFVLATHPDQETTEYWRIRAFGDLAERVRDQVQVGQQGIEATVYGPKYWKGRKKTKDGWEDTVVKGYNAGFVKVPRHYREEQPVEKPQPKQEN